MNCGASNSDSGEKRAPAASEERDANLASGLERTAVRHYDDMTADLYMHFWNDKHIHFGLFDAGEYPEKGGALEGPVSLQGLERMIEAIVAPVGIGEDSVVVDAGCGIGGTCIYLALTRGCQVTGVNVSREQMKIAAGKAAAAGVDRLVDFKYGNCSVRLPFDDDSIDAVVNIESACHYDNRGQFLREVFRILRPGGQVVAMDWLVVEGASAEQRDTFIRPLCEVWASPGLETRSSYAGLLRDAGLTVLECKGFDGRDVGNIRLVEYYVRTLKGLAFLNMLPARLKPVLPMFAALEAAWHGGCFELGRYWAAKPGNG